MIAIIDYEAGNLTSVSRALRYIGIDNMITNDPEKIREAERVIFPGVGAAGSAMASLRRLGLDRALAEAVSSRKPVMGICLGTQIILGYSEENLTSCLGVIEGSVNSFRSAFDAEEIWGLKIPHMGWNRLKPSGKPPRFSGDFARRHLLFCAQLLPGPPTTVECDRHHRLRHRLCFGHRPGQCHRHPVSPGEERYAGASNFKEFQ